MSRKRLKIIKRIIHWLLAAGLVVYIISGFGITEWQTVEPLTFGLMGKALSMRIHNGIEVPFIVLLALHVYLSLIMRKNRDSEAA